LSAHRQAGLADLGAIWLPAVAVAVLAAAAAFELAIAFGAIGIGGSPGEGARGERVALVAALVALLAGGIWAITSAGGSHSGSPVPAGLLAPAAGAFLLARFYSYDPYYAPELRRMSDGGLVPASWIYVLVALAVCAGALTARRRSAGLAVTAPLLLVIGVTALLEQAGH
jgi:hypothetical protein